MKTKVKPCKHCGAVGHSAFTCRRKPRKPLSARKRIKKIGKITKRWLQVRNEWLKTNPADYYICHYCRATVPRSEITLDHYKSRSRHPELRFEPSNLVPCCVSCNKDKGSLNGDEYIRRIASK